MDNQNINEIIKALTDSIANSRPPVSRVSLELEFPGDTYQQMAIHQRNRHRGGKGRELAR